MTLTVFELAPTSHSASMRAKFYECLMLRSVVIAITDIWTDKKRTTENITSFFANAADKNALLLLLLLLMLLPITARLSRILKVSEAR